MADAPWKPDKVLMYWGVDIEGATKGWSWCNLCGSDCHVGVVVGCIERGSAFFCPSCCLSLGELAAIGVTNPPPKGPSS